MKARTYLMLILAATFGIFSCSSSKKTTSLNVKQVADNSLTSVDWQGTYQGILPCADCEGLKTQLVLNENLTYSLKTSYLGKEDNIFETKGTFSWDKSGSKITLDNFEKQVYQVGENKLFHLDKSGSRITGDLANNYIMEKANNEITNKYWKLTELNGKTVKTKKDAFIKLLSEDNRFTGNSSCNVMNGSFELKNSNEITFSKILMTKMACMDDNVESELVSVFEEITNYSATPEELILKDASGKVKAKFGFDYFK
ncbi:MAG TPA: copper resistance protein NlpE N-terminal domain-containing protein [Draconibacterium sp.]|nr:copper resistance protein NlpE N-terminal domain-containing protein [Draconibacterium sp.]